MLKSLIILCGALLTCAATASPLRGQDAESSANLRGLHIGVDPLVYATLSSDYVTGGRTVGGMGLQLRFGWGFTERLSFALDVSVTKLAVADSAQYLLGNGDLLLRYAPGTFRLASRTVVPYIAAGYGLRDISADGQSPTASRIYDLAGEVLAVSAGASVYVRPNLSVFIAYHGGFGEFNDERSGNTTTHNRGLRGESHRASVGMTWHQGRGR